MQPNTLQSLISGRGFSLPVIILIITVFFAADLVHHKWMKDVPPNRGVIKHDVIGYYSYLPAVFIYGDHKLEFISSPGFKNENRFQPLHLENGNRLIQYTCGLSLLYTPFFLIAHAVAPLLGESRDGFNWVYQFFLVISSLFYVAVSLFFLRKLLLKYYSDFVTGVVLILIALATNLFYYTVYEGPMSHSYSFAFIVLFLYLTDRWIEKPTIQKTISLGLVYGIIVLVRPTNSLVLILLLLWGVKNWEDIRERFFFLLRNTPLVLLMILFFLIPWIPQLLYWKSITGHFFYNSYESVGSSFYFDAPQTHKMLFSYRKGWFVYTPVMLLAFGGFVLLFRNRKELFLGPFLYMVVMIYVLSSWWAWWFGGGFGSRSMVDTYAVMALPLAALVDWVMKQRLFWLRNAVFVLFILLTGLQWLQTAQYNRGGIHYVSMDKDAYWHKFFKVKHRGVWPYLSDPDHQLARLGIYYYYDWSADYDKFREMGEEAGKTVVFEEISSAPKMMRSIHRHANRSGITDEEALSMVVERIYSMKSERENLK